MYSVNIQIPRTFYIDSLLEPGAPEVASLGSKVSRVLPGGKTSRNLYQLDMEEESYHAAAPQLAATLAANHVRGVYEVRGHVRDV
jgi:hypothetical protein